LIPYASGVQALTENYSSPAESDKIVTLIHESMAEKYVTPKFARPKPRMGTISLSDQETNSDIIPSGSTSVSAQTSEGFDQLECNNYFGNGQCEIVEPQKHLRWTFSGTFDIWGTPAFAAYVKPSNVDLPVSWRAVVSHREVYNYGSHYPYMVYMTF
jgi:hypothetical protein